MRLIAVAVPVPALDALTYSVPESLPMPVVGARVLVPLGNRTLTGIVVEIISESGERSAEGGGDGGGSDEPGTRSEPRTAPREPGTSIKPLFEILDDSPSLPADVVRLASWVANY